MSSIVQLAPPRARLKELPLDQDRGFQCIWLVVITEAMLFVSMFGAYYYLGSNKDRWAQEVPPEPWLALILLVILVSSSVILHWGQMQMERGGFRAARIAVWVTIVFGLAFLGLQGFEYYSDWASLAPYSDSYGSIFYAITTLHAAHVIAGLLLLIYLGVLPSYGYSERTPHRPYETVTIYWHFVDAVWLFVVIFLYLIPNFIMRPYVH